MVELVSRPLHEMVRELLALCTSRTGGGTSSVASGELSPSSAHSSARSVCSYASPASSYGSVPRLPTGQGLSSYTSPDPTPPKPPAARSAQAVLAKRPADGALSALSDEAAELQQLQRLGIGTVSKDISQIGTLPGALNSVAVGSAGFGSRVVVRGSSCNTSWGGRRLRRTRPATAVVVGLEQLLSDCRLDDVLPKAAKWCNEVAGVESIQARGVTAQRGAAQRGAA